MWLLLLLLFIPIIIIWTYLVDNDLWECSRVPLNGFFSHSPSSRVYKSVSVDEAKVMSWNFTGVFATTCYVESSLCSTQTWPLTFTANPPAGPEVEQIHERRNQDIDTLGFAQSEPISYGFSKHHQLEIMLLFYLVIYPLHFFCHLSILHWAKMTQIWVI